MTPFHLTRMNAHDSCHQLFAPLYVAAAGPKDLDHERARSHAAELEKRPTRR